MGTCCGFAIIQGYAFLSSKTRLLRLAAETGIEVCVSFLELL